MRNHTKFKEGGGFILWRNVHAGMRGAAGSEYIIERLSDGRCFSQDTQKNVRRWFVEASITEPAWTKV